MKILDSKRGQNANYFTTMLKGVFKDHRLTYYRNEQNIKISKDKANIS